MEKIDRIVETIESKIPGAIVRGEDLTGNPDHLHMGLLVASEQFEKMTLLKQHQLVMDILKESLKSDVHAVKLKTMTLEKYQKLTNNA